MRGLAAALLLLAFALRAEIVDRIAVSVGNQIITESQIVEEIRVAAFLNRQAPALTADGKRKAAERLVEQTLFKRDMELSHYPFPSIEEAAGMEAGIRAAYASESAFLSDLERCQITEDELRRHMWWQVAMLRFIEYRFRPAVQVSEAEIVEYYGKKAAEWSRQAAPNIPPLSEARAGIERILTEQRVDQAVDRWLGETRTQMAIRYRQEAF